MLKRQKKISSIVGLLSSFLVGCSSLQIVVPLPHVEVPEVQGPPHNMMYMETQGGIAFEATSDASARPPNLASARTKDLGNTPAIGLGFSFEKLSRLQLSFGGAMLGSSLTSLFTGLQAKLQYQIFGEPTQKAKDSNFSMSIFASGSAPSESKSGDQKGTFGPGGYPWKATISTSAISYGLSTGYRWTPQTLLYFGVATSSPTVKVSIDQSPSTDNSDLGGNYSLSSQLRNQTVTLGLVFGNDGFRWSPDVSYYKVQTNTETFETFHVGMQFHFRL